MSRIKQRIAQKMDDNEEYGGDGIGLFWWLLALVLPPMGFFMGLTEFADNKVGPGIALWAVSGIGVWGWAVMT